MYGPKRSNFNLAIAFAAFGEVTAKVDFAAIGNSTDGTAGAAVGFAVCASLVVGDVLAFDAAELKLVEGGTDEVAAAAAMRLPLSN